MNQASKLLIKSGLKKNIAETIIELIDREEFLTANEYYSTHVPNQLFQIYYVTRFLSIYKKYNKKNKLEPKTIDLYNSCVTYIYKNL
jgi:hypothetical protein